MKRRQIRLYVAGPIQGPTLIHSLANIDAGEAFTARLFQLGFAPFPVFCDHAFIKRVRPLPQIHEIYEYSLTWLKGADSMIVMDGWEKSTGARKEIEIAKQFAVPVFFDITDLCAWADSQEINPLSDAEERMSKSDD